MPYKILDIKLGLKSEWKRNPDEELAGELQKQTAEIHDSDKKTYGNHT